MQIGPWGTVEDYAKFLDERPDWSPILDKDGRVIGVKSPGFDDVGDADAND